MLSAEQIADFEARAAAGERPVLAWGPCYTMKTSGYCPEGLAALLYAEAMDLRDGTVAHWTLNTWDSRRIMFATLAAAQLCGEHILREATRALHAVSLPT